MNDFITIIIVAIIIVGIILYVYFLNKSLNRNASTLSDSERDERRRSIKVSRVSGFIPTRYNAFYDALKVAMPTHYIILPNIAIELLFQRINRKELQLEGQYASFCICTSKFEPILIIQLNEYSVETDAVFVISDDVKALIRSLGIPVMEYDIRDTYIIDDLRRAIAKAMNPLFSDK